MIDMLNRTVFVAVLLSATALTASAQVKPVLPSDAAGRPRTPEAQATLDASTQELMREMKLLGINQLRQPKEAVIPGKPDFANYDEAKANPYPNLPPLMTLKDGGKVTDLAGWNKRRAEIKALFDSQVFRDLIPTQIASQWSNRKNTAAHGGPHTGNNPTARAAKAITRDAPYK